MSVNVVSLDILSVLEKNSHKKPFPWFLSKKGHTKYYLDMTKCRISSRKFKEKHFDCEKKTLPCPLQNRIIDLIQGALCPTPGPAGVDAKLCRVCNIVKQALLAGAPEVRGIMGPGYDSFR